MLNWRANYEIELQEKDDEFQRAKKEYKEELNAKEAMVEQIIADCQAALKAKTAEYEKKLKAKESENEQLHKETHDRKLLQRVEQPNTPKAVSVPKRERNSPVSVSIAHYLCQSYH